MKSAEVYSQLKSELAPWFKSARFKRAKTMLSWYLPCGDNFILIWCQVSQNGWDIYAGSQFVVEFQLAQQPLVGVRGRRQRMAAFLSAAEREIVRKMQNIIISELTYPSQNHPLLQVSPTVTEWYLRSFEQIQVPYRDGHDIWFRYFSVGHVLDWARFIRERLPDCVNVVESWDQEPRGHL